jgi:hypothetical protein
MDREIQCKNRRVVNVEGRLYSPAYDFEGDDGRAWHELGEGDAMCFFGVCSPASYNSWATATANFFEDELVPHYNLALNKAKGISQGAPLPTPLQDKFNKVYGFIKKWDESGIKPDKVYSDNFYHPITAYWVGEIRGIVNYFDEAACMVDYLDVILAVDLNSPAAAKGVPMRTLEAPPGGSYLDGSGGRMSSDKGSSFTSKAIGIMAIGAAGYFGFKVLTE